MKHQFRHYTVFCLICIPLIGFIPGVARACQAPAFFVEGISVSAQARDAQIARRQAMGDALDQAWSRLMDRILLDPAAGPGKDGSVDDLVDYVRVDKETVLPKRYLATLTFCFEQDATRAYLNERGLTYAELTSGKMLVLPAWHISGKPLLWESPNPWADIWVRLIEEHDGLVNLETANNLATQRSLTAKAVVQFDNKAITNAAQLEGAESVVVTEVRAEVNDGKMQAVIYATLFNKNGRREGEIFRLDDLEFDIADAGQVLASMAGEIQANLENVWREVNRVTIQESDSLILRVNAHSARIWSEQLKLLEDLPPVEDVKVLRLDPTGGSVQIFLSSTIQSLTYALESSGLAIDTRQDRNGEQEFVLVFR